MSGLPLDRQTDVSGFTYIIPSNLTAALCAQLEEPKSRTFDIHTINAEGLKKKGDKLASVLRI